MSGKISVKLLLYLEKVAQFIASLTKIVNKIILECSFYACYFMRNFTHNNEIRIEIYSFSKQKLIASALNNFNSCPYTAI